MVEVFKTNVSARYHALMLIDLIHQTFTGYKANFDLQDCDRILRVKSAAEPVHANRIIELLKASGFNAEVLPDEYTINRACDH